MAAVVPLGQRPPADYSCIINGNKNVNIIKILGICVIININCKIKSHKYFKVKMS